MSKPSDFQGFFTEPPREFGQVYDVGVSEELIESLTYIQERAPIVYSALTFKEQDSSEQKPKGLQKRSVNPYSPFVFRSAMEPLESWDLVSQIDAATMAAVAKANKVTSEDIKLTSMPRLFKKSLYGVHTLRPTTIPEITAPEPAPVEGDEVFESIRATPSELPLRVFCSDKGFASIVSSPRTLVPFVLNMKKIGNDVILLDEIPYETNQETLTTTTLVNRDKITQDFYDNIPESTNLNASFINVARGGEEVEKSYLYRRIVVPGTIEFIVRCEIDVISEPAVEGERPLYGICRTYNEAINEAHNSNWIKEFGSHRAGLSTAEVSENSAKSCRWAAIANIAGAANIYIGYTVRQNNSRRNHACIAVEKFAPIKYARNVSLSVDQMYGLASLIFGRLEGREDGDYVYIRDPKKKLYRIYATN